jgi:hypothetical protein
MTIQIKNLTQAQVEMLDTMWSLDSESEYFEWYDQLTVKDQHCADVLQRLVILEVMEETLGDCAEAKAVLKRFQL